MRRGWKDWAVSLEGQGSRATCDNSDRDKQGANAQMETSVAGEQSRSVQIQGYYPTINTQTYAVMYVHKGTKYVK